MWYYSVQGEGVNQPMVSHTAESEEENKLLDALKKKTGLKTVRFLSTETELSTSWWLFVCFGFFIHNFAILYTVEG